MIRKAILLLLLLGSGSLILAQSYYYPPAAGVWDTTSPTDLGWQADSLAALQSYLGDKNTKAFLVLKSGRIVVEWYYDSFQPDSLWYWASAGKTLTATLIGLAQTDSLLSIHNPSSAYLGPGWTSLDSAQEAAITIWHQLTMTTGLDDFENFDCLIDTCLTYKADPGTRWAYHNGPYTLLTSVIAQATGGPINQYLNLKLNGTIGMFAFYQSIGPNRVVISTPRSMARFGLLMLSHGFWNGQSVVDSAWIAEMIQPSQTLNPSYGYLWWLNGQGNHMLPGLQLLFPSDLIPNAPDDLVAGLGKNDQKLYLVPSQDLVIIRMGNEAGASSLASSSFDNELWGKISRLDQGSTAIDPAYAAQVSVHPNPGRQFRIDSPSPIRQWQLLRLDGRLLRQGNVPEAQLSDLPTGIYLLRIEDQQGRIALHRWHKQ